MDKLIDGNLFTIVCVLLVLLEVVKTSMKSEKDSRKTSTSKPRNDYDYEAEDSVERNRRKSANYVNKLNKELEMNQAAEDDHYYNSIADHERRFELAAKNAQ